VEDSGGENIVKMLLYLWKPILTSFDAVRKYLYPGGGKAPYGVFLLLVQIDLLQGFEST